MPDQSHEDGDPLSDSLGDALARKALPLAQLVIQRRLARRAPRDDQDFTSELIEQLEEQRTITTPEEDLPPPHPSTHVDDPRLGGLASWSATAAALDRTTGDQPSTPTVDEHTVGLEDAAHHQHFADAVANVARSGRRHYPAVRRSPAAQVPVGSTTTVRTTQRHRSPSRAR